MYTLTRKIYYNIFYGEMSRTIGPEESLSVPCCLLNFLAYTQILVPGLHAFISFTYFLSITFLSFTCSPYLLIKHQFPQKILKNCQKTKSVSHKAAFSRTSKRPFCCHFSFVFLKCRALLCLTDGISVTKRYRDTCTTDSFISYCNALRCIH